ncbi:glycoside hydrolase family 15 protein [soil metagenome]
MTSGPRNYRSIADYGVIGNLSTVAHISTDGSIDWCCLPYMDSQSVFAGILDANVGGFFQVKAARTISTKQRYIGETNVLETAFDTDGGRLLITDFMPVAGDLDAAAEVVAPPEIHRVLHAVDGDVEVEVIWMPRFDYAQTTTSIEAAGAGFLASARDHRLVLAGLPDGIASIQSGTNGQRVEGRFTLRSGSRLALVTRWDAADASAPLARSMELLQETTAAWNGWVHKAEASGDRSWAGAWSEHVIRSELALKLLVFAPSGAIAAAPTTSLPEGIGGVRNWDYRFSWIRDAGLSAQALFALGHGTEAERYISWAEKVAREKGDADWGLRLMYTLWGEYCIPETTLPHLEGYRGSSPVRIGNAAAEQKQLDVYGELIAAAYEVARLGGKLPDDTWPFVLHLADQAQKVWQDKDAGIWEVRGEPRHHVYSKVMVWVALNRAGRLARHGLIDAEPSKWDLTQKLITEEVLERGFDPNLNSFVVAYDVPDFDASNLLLPLLEFLPFDDPRVQGTIDGVLERLTASDLVYRYRFDDGLPGEEGAFVFCTFWLADALALSGRIDEAYRIFDGITSRVNHLGLLPEQIDPHSGAFLGNYPQAFSHIGLINSALYLAHVEGRETPVAAPVGTEAHRIESGNW